MAIAGRANAADLSLAVTGNLIGSVTDGAGIPQMGATVQLLNRYERVLSKAITASDGRFIFVGLPFDTYAIRVSQPSFLPAFRDRITIRPGTDSVLQIHMATLFSNIQVSYKIPSGAMTNDWKWALRTSASTRPVTRLLPELKKRGESTPRAQIFSDTHAMVRFNGGDGGMIDTGTASSDLGSIFALSTNLFGNNQVQVAGSFGQGSDFAPSVRGLAAVYQRNSDNAFLNAPEVTLTVSQFSRFAPSFAGPNQLPDLRLMSLSIYQVSDPLENVHLEYGVTAQSVSYLQDSSRISPFARATISLDSATEIVAAYSDGGRPDELVAHATAMMNDTFSPDSVLGNAVNALGRMPQVSSHNDQLVSQRTQNYEVGYTHRIAGRTYAVSAFREQVWNGQLNLSGNVSAVNSGNLFFDGMSKTSTYNIGGYSRIGYAGTVNQRISEHMDFGVTFGRMGGFSTADPAHMFSSATPSLQVGLHDVAAAQFRAAIPATGTKFTAGYGWMDSGSFVPLHVFVTQPNMMSPGLNFGFQQPIPSLFGLPGHLELTADLRNLLAQGYIPVGPGGPNQLLVVQSPRAIRGGLNLTF